MSALIYMFEQKQKINNRPLVYTGASRHTAQRKQLNGKITEATVIDCDREAFRSFFVVKKVGIQIYVRFPCKSVYLPSGVESANTVLYRSPPMTSMCYLSLMPSSSTMT